MCGGWIKKENAILEEGKWESENVEEKCRMGVTKLRMR